MNLYNNKKPKDAKVITTTDQIALDIEDRKFFSESLENCKNDKSEKSISSKKVLNSKYSVSWKLKSTAENNIISLEDQNKVSVEYICAKPFTYFVFRFDDELQEGIKIMTYSDTATTIIDSFIGGGIILFYSTIIIVIAQLVRRCNQGDAEKTMFTEFPDTSALINLCEGIKISRYKKEFKR